jgi:BMFP domain-containing protein YqiC
MADRPNHDLKQLATDLLQLGTALFGTLLSGRSALQDKVSANLQECLHKTPFVTRADFDALHAMISQARLRQEELAQRLQELEKSQPQTKAAPAKKPLRRGPKQSKTTRARKS